MPIYVRLGSDTMDEFYIGSAQATSFQFPRLPPFVSESMEYKHGIEKSLDVTTFVKINRLVRN